MELDNIITLIKTVSDSSLSSFTLEQGDVKISLENSKEIVALEESNAITIKSTVNTASREEIPEGHIVKSPLVGMFYSAPSQDDEDYVKVGDTVSAGQTLAIIEAMKLMNEIECECDGIVEKVYVDNETAVEYGQPLFLIKPM